MSYRTEPLDRYVADAAAGEPTPGGGSVSAFAGALAAAMGEMAANFTTGRKKFADAQNEVQVCLAELCAAREELVQLMQQDVDAYASVSAAYAMPRQTDRQKTARKEAVQDALKGAMDVPLEAMRQCARVGLAAANLVQIANPNLITDVGVSAILAEAACAAARLNVEINLKYIRDEELVRQVRPEIDRLTQQTKKCRQEVAGRVYEHLA